MKFRGLIFAVVALIMASITVHLVRQRLNQVTPPAAVVAVKAPSTAVLVAANDLAAGSLLQVADLRWQSWPDDRVDSTYLREDQGTIQSMVGSVVRSRIAQGEPVASGMVLKPGDRGFLAAVLAPGMDAISAPVSVTSAAGGLIVPGDHVDLLLDHQVIDPAHPAELARVVSETIMVDVRVVAIDQTIGDEDKKALNGRTFTFEVTPKQAEAIEVAKQIGNIAYALRSAATGDPSIASTVGSRTWDSDVSALLVRTTAKAESRGGASVTVFRGDVGGGGGESTVSLPSGGGKTGGINITVNSPAATPASATSSP